MISPSHHERYILIILIVFFCLFSFISISYPGLKIDEMAAHLPTLLHIYNSSGNVNDLKLYNTPNAPLPYFILGYLSRLLKITPGIVFARVSNISVAIIVMVLLLLWGRKFLEEESKKLLLLIFFKYIEEL